MDIDLKTLLTALIVSTATFTVVASAVFWANQQRAYRNLMFFWASNGLHLILAYFVRSDDLRIVWLGQLSLLWRMPIMRWILEDITGRGLKRPWHYPLHWCSYPVGGCLMYLGFPFEIYALPVAASVFVVGIDFILAAWHSLPKEDRSSTHMFLIVVFVAIMFHKLDYPFLRPKAELATFGYFLTLVLNVMVGALLPGIVAQGAQRAYTRELSRLVEERSQQLIVQAPTSAMGALASGVAHEINNPLGIITAWAGRLIRQVKAEEQVNKEDLLYGLEKINSTAFRISKVVRSLRDFSEVERISEAPAAMALSVVVDDAMTFCRERFETQQVELRLHSLENLYVTARGVELSQALLYMLLNSLDAVKDREERWIEIKAMSKGTRVQLIISDSGEKISEEVALNMMHPFYTTKPLGVGAGMGLTLAKGIVENHQGSLIYREGDHTTFVMDLPSATLS